MTRLEALEHLFEEDAFVGRVLVEQHQAALGFEQHVKTAHDADDSQGALEQGDGQRTGCHRKGGNCLAGMGGLGLAGGRHRVQGHGRRWGRREGAGGRPFLVMLAPSPTRGAYIVVAAGRWPVPA